jgi:hypothetical protein
MRGATGKEPAMLKILVTSMTVAVATLVGYTVLASTHKHSQTVDAKSQKKQPKLGYADLFIPPTKGNGF